MRRFLFGVGVGIMGFVLSGSARAQPAAQPQPATQPQQAVQPPLRAPQNIHAEPATPASTALSTRSAKAEMAGDHAAAVRLAEAAMDKEPRDPWPYYHKADALASMGRTDEAVNYFKQAEKRFAGADPWGQSVAIYGRAHALAEVGRCDEARAAFRDYATLVEKADPKASDMALQYAGMCNAPRTPPAGATEPPAAH